MFAQTALVAEIGRLQKFAYSLTRNKPDADDLVQSTCLRALEKANSFKDGTNLTGWTSKIMFNLFATNYRRRNRFETRFDPEIDINHEAVEPAQETNMELSNVERAMVKLSADHHEILHLVCVKGMQYDEVAKMLKIPVGTVRSRLSRARSQLHEILRTPQVKPARKLRDMVITANENMPHIPAYISSWAMQRDSR